MKNNDKIKNMFGSTAFFNIDNTKKILNLDINNKFKRTSKCFMYFKKLFSKLVIKNMNQRSPRFSYFIDFFFFEKRNFIDSGQ